MYRPVRERGARHLMELAERSLAATGYLDVSLLSLSTGDYSGIEPLLCAMMSRFGPNKVAVSLPSMRAETLTPRVVQEIRRVRKTGFTIAPEAGSQRLRDIINKNLTEQDVLDAAQAAFSAGWRLIKLYFMIGLPGETAQDVDEAVELVRRVKKLGGKKADVTASFGVFVPKPHTPFQWAAQRAPEQAWEVLDKVRAKLRGRGLKVKWHDPRVSLMEGVLARGGRGLSRTIEAAHGLGCRMDGWTDHFRFDLWHQAMEATGVDPLACLAEKNPEEPLAWDHVDARISKDYLKNEWHKSRAAETTAACSDGNCSGCGVCDFQAVKPQRAVEEALEVSGPEPIQTPAGEEPGVRVWWSKTGPARWFGHLEVMDILARAVIRARIPVAFTQGFHPKPRMACGDALPVGMESEAEPMALRLQRPMEAGEVARRLAETLPQGLGVVRAEKMWKRAKEPLGRSAEYRIYPPTGALDPDAVGRFLAAEAWMVEKANKKGESVAADLKQMVTRLTVHGGVLEMTFASRPGVPIRPLEAAARILGTDPDTARHWRIRKLARGGS